MAGNVKFEPSSASPEDLGFSGSYPSGQRGNYPGPSLDRSGSFREGSDGRSFSSGTSTSKPNAPAVADLPPWPQCLLLEPISMGDYKYKRAGELRRALGFTFGNVSEDNSFGVTHSKPSPTLAADEVKRFRASVYEGCQKAKMRIRKMDESLNKLNKYCEALISKKQQTNERSGGSNLLKTGNQSRRSSPDVVTQKLEERNKSIGLNKRARTPIADMRPEGRSNGLQRQHLAVPKDKDVAKDGRSDLVEEKIRRLPAGREGWEKKMKRKRSVSSGFPRPLDGDAELNRTMHGRLGNDSAVHASDSVGFRSGPSNGASGNTKLDRSPSPASLNGRMTPKNESEKPPLSRELTGMNKEKLQKGNPKLNIREETHLFSPTSLTKGKASRAHRTGHVSAGNSSPSFPQLSGTPEDWEQPANVNKVHPLAGVNNRKRPLPTESSSAPMAQWVGQRPHKISRNRRTNIVSPTSNHDEAQTSSEGCDFSVRVSGGMNGSLPARNVTSSSQQLKMKLENASSPARLSESEETSAAEFRLKNKILCGSEADERGIHSHQHASPSGFTKKSKMAVKEEIGEAVHRQGRPGRGSSYSKGGMSPLREKLENPGGPKPVRSAKPGSEKNGSKSGRPPLKKQSDRKAFTRLGTLPNNSSEFAGESDDDREELMAAAQFACNASYNGCSSVFWKKMEPLFYIRLEDKSFLEKQLRYVDEYKPNLSEMSSLGASIVNEGLRIEDSQAHNFISEESKNYILENGSMDSAESRAQEDDSSCRGRDAGKGAVSLTPLYQRVLSALIVEDDFEEFEDNSFGSNAASLANGNDPVAVAERISSNGNSTYHRFSSLQVPVHEELEEGDYGSTLPIGQAGPGFFQNDANGSPAISVNACGDSSLEYGYHQMCIDEKLLLELQSFGLYPDRVPDLAEGEDELINQDIVQLKQQLGQQAGMKKAYLDRVHKSIEEKKEFEGRELEQLAMNRLTELAFKKLLATRGSSAARIGVSKVSRHVALAFIRRTLARCRKFENAGTSCFSEPALRDVLFATPNNNAEQNILENARTSGSYPTGSEQLDLQNEKSERGPPFDAYEPSDQAFVKNGPILNRGKKKEVLLDDVSGNATMRSTSIHGTGLFGGVKGKRSERDSGAKGGRPSITNIRGERKAKSKPKQKASQMSTHPVQPSANAPNKRREGLISPGNIPNSSKDGNDSLDLGGLPLPSLDPIEELTVANEFDGHQDLSSWLNFDEDGLQDHDSMGLEIPMDDLSDLHMLL